MAHEEITASIHGFVTAVNQGDQALALDHLTADVSIVEDIPPYRWQGSGAGPEWMAAMMRNAELTGVTGISMQIGGATRIESDGQHGYAVVPGVLILTGDGVTLRSQGSLTFSLRKSERWLISCFAWSGPAPRA